MLLTGLNRLGAAPVPYGPVRDAGDAVEHAVKNNITSMVGIPTHFLAMVRNQHGNRLSGKIKSLLLTTDHVPDSVCRIIEKEWGAFPYNHYGMTEMGLGGGVQCAARDGMHLREADLFFEIVDPATGRQLPDGDEGEVVFTTLTRTGMPLIRYRTGDISRFLPYRCPCGTSLRSLEKITKRVSGIIPLEEGNITIADLDEALFPLPGILDFRVHIMKKPDSAEMIIDLKTVANTKPGQSDIIDALLEIPVVKKLYPDKLRIGIEWNGVEFSVSTGTAKRHIFVV